MASNAPKRHSDQSSRLVWLIVLIGLLTSVCTLIGVRQIARLMGEQRAELNTTRDSIDDLSVRINHGFVAVIDSVRRQLQEEPGITIDKAMTTVTEELKRFDQSSHADLMKPGMDRIRDFFVELGLFHDYCARWSMRSRSISTSIETQERRLAASFVAMRAALTSAEGRRRLELASQIRSFRKLEGDEAADVARQIVDDVSAKNDAAEFREELANLELLCERLLAEEQLERLTDLKDNQFAASITHSIQMLSRTGKFASASSEDLKRAFNDFQLALLGTGHRIDVDHQTIFAGSDGLFALCQGRLEARRERESLRTELTRRTAEYQAAALQIETLTGTLKDDVADQAERSLARGWHTLLIVAVACAGVLALLGRRVALKIREQFDVIQLSEAQLQQSNAQMAAIHETSLESVMVLDSEQRIVEFNPSAEQTFRCTRDQAMGRSLADFICIACQHPADDMQNHLGQQLEVSARRSDGAEFPVEVAITATEQAGAPIYVVSLRDLTERKRTESEKDELNQRLLSVSREAGMAEVATGVLHNVGNALNSVNVSVGVVNETLRQSETATLTKLGELLAQNRADPITFLRDDERGRLIPEFIIELAECLNGEHQSLVNETHALTKAIEHVKQIISAQQSLAKRSTLRAAADPVKVVESALLMQQHALKCDRIELKTTLSRTGTGMIDSHKVLQILMNLINNARQAVSAVEGAVRMISVRLDVVGQADTRHVRIEVADTGCGIASDVLGKLFTHGFTTKADGHGFGLHSAANAAREMGGSLSASSQGPGHGATFVLDLPFPVPTEGELCQAA